MFNKKKRTLFSSSLVPADGEDVTQCVAVKQHGLMEKKKKKEKKRWRVTTVERKKKEEEEEAFSHELLGLKMQAHSHREANEIKYEEESV